jgi:hypothetical protein
MGDNNSSPLLQPLLAAGVSKKPAGWCLLNHTASSAQLRISSRQREHENGPSLSWSAIQQDFEQRLNRFGIKVSEAKYDQPSNPLNPTMKDTKHAKATPIISACGVSHATMNRNHYEAMPISFIGPKTTTESFPPLKAPTMARFMNDKKEPKLEAMNQELRKALAEVQIWKEKSEAYEQDLHASYKETMEWRTKYEDLYSAVIQNRALNPSNLQEKREDTQSLV